VVAQEKSVKRCPFQIFPAVQSFATFKTFVVGDGEKINFGKRQQLEIVIVVRARA
jgi:hypothetical protein